MTRLNGTIVRYCCLTIMLAFLCITPDALADVSELNQDRSMSAQGTKEGKSVKIKGYIAYAADDYIVVDDQEIYPTEKLKIIRDKDKGLVFANLQTGWDVEVKGKIREDGTVAAKEIKVKTKRKEKINIKGYVEEVGDGFLIIEGRKAILTDTAKIKIEDPTIGGVHDLKPGRRVGIKGVLKDDGIIRIRELKVKERDLQDRAKLLNLSQEEEKKLVEKLELYEDKDVREYVEGLGKSLVPDHAAEDIEFSFTVIKDPSLNAFALPHGAIYLHTGLLARMENESQLATVVGHEIAHVTHEHGYRQYRSRYKIGLGILAAQIGAAVLATQIDNRYLEQTVYAGLGLTVAAAVNGYGRKLEDEADRVGLRYIVNDEFDPREAPEVWQTFRKTYGDQSGVENFFYGNHSTSRQREKNLKKEIALHYTGVIDQNQDFRINEQKYQRTMRYLIRDNAIEDYKIKRYNLAKEQFEKVITLIPGDAKSLYYLGNIERQTAKDATALDRAIDYYQEAIHSDPAYAEVYRELGYTYERKGDKLAAISNLRRYLELEPNAPDARSVRKRIRKMS